MLHFGILVGLVTFIFGWVSFAFAIFDFDVYDSRNSKVFLFKVKRVLVLKSSFQRYLIAQNKGPEARSALQWLRGQNVDISFELADMETANILSKKQAFKIKELFKSAYLKPLGVSLGLMFAQQFSGINAVMFYSVSIFRVSFYPF